MGNTCLSRPRPSPMPPDIETETSSVACDGITNMQAQLDFSRQRTQARAAASRQYRTSLAQKTFPSTRSPSVFDLPSSRIIDDVLYYELDRLILMPRSSWVQLECGGTLRSMHRAIRRIGQPVLILVYTADGCKLGALAGCNASRPAMNFVEPFLFALLYASKTEQSFRVLRWSGGTPDVRLQHANDVARERLIVGSQDTHFCLTKGDNGLHGRSSGDHILLCGRKSFLVYRFEVWSVWADYI